MCSPWRRDPKEEQVSVGITSEAFDLDKEQPAPQVGEKPTTETETSTESEKAQEQGADELPEDKLEELIAKDKRLQERIYRQAQSMKDKELHAERLRMQQEKETAEEQARLRDMTNSEYGAYRREQEALSQKAQEQVAQVLRGQFQKATEEALSLLSPEARARVEAEQHESLGQFIQSVAKARTDAEVAQRVKAEEKKLREVIRKELQAEMSEQFAPDTGRGTPSSRRDNVHGEAAIAAGLEEKFAEARKKQGL